MVSADTACSVATVRMVRLDASLGERTYRSVPRAVSTPTYFSALTAIPAGAGARPTQALAGQCANDRCARPQGGNHHVATVSTHG